MSVSVILVALVGVIAFAMVAPVTVESGGSMSSDMGATQSAVVGPSPKRPITDPAVRRQLRAQLATAQATVERINTAADATKRGYVQVTVDLAFLGVHYMNPEALTKPFNPRRPTHLVFATDEPDSELVGLMYYTRSSDRAPDGFAGERDQWHIHEAACMGSGVMLALDDVTPAACERLGGVITPLPPEFRDRWMLHVWVVAGARNPWGVFAEGHPALA